LLCAVFVIKTKIKIPENKSTNSIKKMIEKNEMIDDAVECLKEKERSYQCFVRCCHDYTNNINRLFNISKTLKTDGNEVYYVKNSDLDYVLQNSLKEQTAFVESSFDKLNKKDPILAKIMYLNLVENKTFDEIGKRRLVEVSRRSASRKYAKKNWERLFNETVLGRNI
jgi:hypothetical protein